MRYFCTRRYMSKHIPFLMCSFYTTIPTSHLLECPSKIFITALLKCSNDGKSLLGIRYYTNKSFPSLMKFSYTRSHDLYFIAQYYLRILKIFSIIEQYSFIKFKKHFIISTDFNSKRLLHPILNALVLQ